MLVRFRILTGGILGVLLVSAAFTREVSAAPVPADRVKVEKDMAAVAAKLHGSWSGSCCEGQMTFHLDRTYEWTGRGPGGECDKGVWALRGDPAQPTLVMECKTSDNTDRVGKTVELSLVRVDAESLTLKYAGAEQSRNYPRANKGIASRTK